MLAGLLILLPTISFPLGADHGVYFLGGRVMMDGGLLYYDFIDVKPPMLFLLYGVVGNILGTTAIAMHSADVIWHLGVIYLLIQLLRQHGVSNLATWCSVLLYSLLYATLGHNPTVQAESFFALPMVGILLLVDRPASWSRDILIGLLTGFAFLLKYPLAIVGPGAVLLFLVRGDGWRTSCTALLRIGLTSAAFIAAILWPMITDPRFIPAFTEVINYLKVYSASDGYSVSGIIRALDTTGNVWANNISFLVCIALALGIMSYRKPLVTNALFFSLLLLATVVLENKYFGYHFSRMFLPLAIVAGLGLSAMLDRARRLNEEATPFSKGVLICSALVLLVFSPLPRIANITVSAAQWLGNPDAVTNRIKKNGNTLLDFEAMESLRPFVQHQVPPHSKVMVVGMRSSNLMLALDNYDVGPFADAHFYLGIGRRDSWHRRAIDHLSHSALVAVDTNDIRNEVNLHPYTSFQAVQRDSALYHVLTHDFDLTDRVAEYMIYTPKR